MRLSSVMVSGSSRESGMIERNTRPAQSLRSAPSASNHPGMRSLPAAHLLCFVCAITFASALTRAEEPHTIWQEGEQPTTASVKRHPWWYDQVTPGELSGGAWISNFSKEQEGTAEYRVEVPASGTYHFWVRANPAK